MGAEIQSERFLLREIGEADVTERYLDWLGDPEATKYIATAAKTKNLSDLRQYVCDRISRPDVMFLGVFDRENGLHVGNIKFEPLDSRAGYAVVGVLIGDPAYRGKGVTSEVLRSSSDWLKEHRGIRQLALGVNAENRGAIRAYEKSGFVAAETEHIPNPAQGSITMVLDL